MASPAKAVNERWIDRLAQHPVIVLIGIAAAVLTIVGFGLQLSGNAGSNGGTTVPPEGPTTSNSEDDDQAIANRVVLGGDDLAQGWSTVSGQAREANVASYEAVPECESVVPVIRGDGETAIAGRSESFVNGNTAVSVIVTFYEDEELASQNGPALLLDLDYQRCIRTRIETSVKETNDGVEDFGITSRELPAPSYGQRTEAVQYISNFNLPLLGNRTFYADQWSIQIGRAVLLMTWSADTEFDPFELELIQLVGQRFEREMSLYGE